MNRSTLALVSVSAAAKRYDVHPRTIRRRIADGTLRAYRVGRLVKVDLNEADEALLRPIPAGAA
ncbi:excisionase family DNA-binding protein [Cellulomonas sp. APG4]|uniref:excisionase family DNA-binding protein n=1 Tax=Cellulomonas sp. APG4 TaxID=1538656 RepID=UPI00137991CE|nr:excisionase family DNA-binding protein [Cellulomonas sp. APG4]